MMTNEELTRRLRAEGIVKLEPAEWREVADAWEEVARHPTQLAGDIVLVRDREGLAALEAPSPRERVIRRLEGEEEARRFVEDRLETYERMWDGCGCRVEYYR
ncbi:MAG: hypothetical protein PVI57_18225 [Gemmatimonadota bacterium]|jgi:hypothetical protein